MLECWNIGKMGFGMLGKWSAAGGTIKLKMDNIHLLTSILSEA